MVFQRFARYYNHILGRHTYKVQIVSGGVLWFAGDLLCQGIVHRMSDSEEPWKVDWTRIRNMVTYGTCFAAPLYTFWYSFLDKTAHKYLASSVSPQFVPRIYRIIGAKLLADVFLFDPLYLAFFFIATNTLEGNTMEQIKLKLKREFGVTYLVDILLWSPIQFLNFRYVPVSYQALLVQGCNLGWNAFLSFMQHRDEGGEKK